MKGPFCEIKLGNLSTYGRGQHCLKKRRWHYDLWFLPKTDLLPENLPNKVWNLRVVYAAIFFIDMVIMVKQWRSWKIFWQIKLSHLRHGILSLFKIIVTLMLADNIACQITICTCRFSHLTTFILWHGKIDISVSIADLFETKTWKHPGPCYN